MIALLAAGLLTICNGEASCVSCDVPVTEWACPPDQICFDDGPCRSPPSPSRVTYRRGVFYVTRFEDCPTGRRVNCTITPRSGGQSLVLTHVIIVPDVTFVDTIWLPQPPCGVRPHLRTCQRWVSPHALGLPSSSRRTKR